MNKVHTGNAISQQTAAAAHRSPPPRHATVCRPRTGTCFSTTSSQASIAGQSSLCTSVRAAGKEPAKSRTRHYACQDHRCLDDRAGTPTVLGGVSVALTSSRKDSDIVSCINLVHSQLAAAGRGGMEAHGHAAFQAPHACSCRPAIRRAPSSSRRASNILPQAQK